MKNEIVHYLGPDKENPPPRGHKHDLPLNFSLAKQRAKEARISTVSTIRDGPARMENLFREGSDWFNIFEYLFFSLFPLLEIRIIPSGVAFWIPGTQDCGVLVRNGCSHVRPTRLS